MTRQLDNFRSQDAIIRINSQRTIVDVPKFIVGILREEWEPLFNDGVTPTVELYEDAKAIRFAPPDDFVLAYETPGPTQPITIGHQFENAYTVVSLDFRTGANRAHRLKLVAEAKRVLQAHRTDIFDPDTTLSGRHWLQWGIRDQDFGRNQTGMWRRVVDSQINHRAVEVET